MVDQLLSEVDRQQKYLDRLPSDFEFPLFNARYALESQRSSGYRTTAAAARELVDNAIEAGASRIHVVFDTERNSAGHRIVTAIAFIDNGSGMLPKMARFALSWGGGTHFDDPSYIGKFGFGLPNASINQARRTDVYTRLSNETAFARVPLDIDEFVNVGIQSIPEPEDAELPEFVQKHLNKEGWTLDHGTVVVWRHTDRLTYRRTASLKEHLVEDFGSTYRYLLADPTQELEIEVEGVQIAPVDPLFIMPEGRYYLPPEYDEQSGMQIPAVDRGGAHLIHDLSIPVKYFVDQATGERHLRRIDGRSELDPGDPDLLAAGAIHVKVVRFPIGFARGRGEPKGTDVYRRFEIRKRRRGMSFVRANREIDTVDVFPRTERDKVIGLGDWPLLQSYAYHWGIEVRFQPNLDDVFGITNDKQGVRPIEDFWRVLTQEDVDDYARHENNWQGTVRDAANQPTAEPSQTVSPAEQASQEADVALGERLRIPERLRDQAIKQAEIEAQQRVDQSQGAISIEEALKAFEKESVVRKYRIAFESVDHGPFFRPEWVGSQVVIWINRRHPFYEVLYQDLLGISGGALAKEAIDVVLIALGKAELHAEYPEMADWYAAQRKYQWSKFLEVAMRNLERRLAADEEAVVDAEVA